MTKRSRAIRGAKFADYRRAADEAVEIANANAAAMAVRTSEDEVIGQLVKLMLWLRRERIPEGSGPVRIADHRIGGAFHFG